MAGVASPMLQRDAKGAMRFLVALVLGEVTAGLVLAGVVVLFGSLLDAVLPVAVRLLTVVALAVVFGVADWFGRTPHVWRQVPKRLAERLPPGTLGLVWGFDLGLLFTTQKTTSLLWMSLAAVLVIDPMAAPLALVVWSAVAGLAVAAWTLMPNNQLRLAQEVPWIRTARRMSAVAMLVSAAATVLAMA
jgi:hypothetical protein